MYIFKNPPKVRHIAVLPGVAIRMPECKLIFTDVPTPLVAVKVLRSK
jgi:hypothetical protein